MILRKFTTLLAARYPGISTHRKAEAERRHRERPPRQAGVPGKESAGNANEHVLHIYFIRQSDFVFSCVPNGAHAQLNRVLFIGVVFLITTRMVLTQPPTPAVRAS